MKKMYVLFILTIGLAGMLLASPFTWSGWFYKEGSYSYYPELTKLWKPVDANNSRIILFGNPGINMKYNNYSKQTEDMPYEWTLKLDGKYQLHIIQGSMLYLDVAPGEHVFTLDKLQQPLLTEAGKTYYLELNMNESKDGIYTQITDETEATKLLAGNRHIFRDPFPFNQQPKAKALFKGNKIFKK